MLPHPVGGDGHDHHGGVDDCDYADLNLNHHRLRWLAVGLKYFLRRRSWLWHGAEPLPVHRWPLPPEKLELELQLLVYESSLVHRWPQLLAHH
jgi:hypothetical protein